MKRARLSKITRALKMFLLGCVVLVMLSGCFTALSLLMPALRLRVIGHYDFLTTTMRVAVFSLLAQTSVVGGVKYSFTGQPRLSVTTCPLVAVFSLYDPMIMQLPAHVWPSEGTYESQTGGPQSGNLVLSQMPFVPVTSEQRIYPEPGHRLYMIDFPEGVDLSLVAGEEREFDFQLKLFNSLRETDPYYQAKVISTVKVALDNRAYYLPLYPLETDFAKLPAVTLGGTDGDEYEVELPDMSGFPVPEAVSYDMRASGLPLQGLFYPHINCDEGWQTELALINDDDSVALSGTLIFFSDSAEVLAGVQIALAPHGRKEFDVGKLLGADAVRAGYALFEYRQENWVVGYAKYFVPGVCRTAIPAMPSWEISQGEIYIPHVAAGGEWWTAISLLNANSTAKTVEIVTNMAGDSWTINVVVEPFCRRYFTFAEMLPERLQTNLSSLSSATITNGAGIIGLELFGSKFAGVNKYLSGVLLRDDTVTTMYYPHTVSDQLWWTGVVGYNPQATTAGVTITPYNAAGESLAAMFSGGTLSILGQDKYLGAVANLQFPVETAWFKLESSQPLTGFELFGKVDGSQLAGYTSCNIDTLNGIFPKLEKSGWTGIAFVNIGRSSTVTLRAYNDAGELVATSEPLALAANEKKVAVAEAFFTADISSATYLTFSADSAIVGFQLNSSTDGMMLDGLPALQ